ncbi:helix-turn-helix domain-containing protein [Occallatibacter savannae]|uniref:helix-turn-helix domain-containing protein n=1 Tax=Occallatibacter savannae TaxID=1002691 RepID=UPI000D688506|nr:helix-turn-helix transcriptional regulator [Occallatibacter savannae]
MSVLFEISPPSTDRDVWARLFGQLIREARECRGSIEYVAGRASMPAAEWAAIEAGEIPTSIEQLETLAAALDMEWRGMVALVGLCRDAWGA